MPCVLRRDHQEGEEGPRSEAGPGADPRVDRQRLHDQTLAGQLHEPARRDNGLWKDEVRPPSAFHNTLCGGLQIIYTYNSSLASFVSPFTPSYIECCFTCVLKESFIGALSVLTFEMGYNSPAHPQYGEHDLFHSYNSWNPSTRQTSMGAI